MSKTALSYSCCKVLVTATGQSFVFINLAAKQGLECHLQVATTDSGVVLKFVGIRTDG